MNKWSAGLRLVLMLLCSVTEGGEATGLSIRLSVKEQCLAQLPVVCKVTIKNEGPEKRDVYVPSSRDDTLVSAVRRVGEAAFEGPVISYSKLYDNRKVVTLKPGQEMEGSIDLWYMLPKGLSVGEYECMVRYRFGNGNNEEIEGWSNKFRVVEPTKKQDKRANERLNRIRSLLVDTRTNRVEMALKLLLEFEVSPDAAAPGYLAQARLLTRQWLLAEGRWLEYASQLEKLRQAPPEWMSAEDITLELCYLYYRGGRYDKTISLSSEMAEQNPAAKRLLNDAKRKRSELPKSEGPGTNSVENTVPLSTGDVGQKREEK